MSELAIQKTTLRYLLDRCGWLEIDSGRILLDVVGSHDASDNLWHVTTKTRAPYQSDTPAGEFSLTKLLRGEE